MTLKKNNCTVTTNDYTAELQTAHRTSNVGPRFLERPLALYHMQRTLRFHLIDMQIQVFTICMGDILQILKLRLPNPPDLRPWTIHILPHLARWGRHTRTAPHNQ